MTSTLSTELEKQYRVSQIVRLHSYSKDMAPLCKVMQLLAHPVPAMWRYYHIIVLNRCRVSRLDITRVITQGSSQFMIQLKRHNLAYVRRRWFNHFYQLYSTCSYDTGVIIVNWISTCKATFNSIQSDRYGKLLCLVKSELNLNEQRVQINCAWSWIGLYWGSPVGYRINQN